MPGWGRRRKGWFWRDESSGTSEFITVSFSGKENCTKRKGKRLIREGSTTSDYIPDALIVNIQSAVAVT